MSETELFQTDYDKTYCAIGRHLGFGAFHVPIRLSFIDDYMQETGDLCWGIAAVNLRKADAPTFQSAARAADGYVLKQLHQMARLITGWCALLAFFDASSFDILAPSVHAVTITVTESGYYVDQDWKLDLEAAPIADGILGKKSETVYAYLAEALAGGAQHLDAPLTILCCDNIRSNGDMLKDALLAYQGSGSGRTGKLG